MPANQPPTSPGPKWTIEYQRQTTQQAPGGGFQQGVEIGYVTNMGVHASLFVPYDKYTPDQVKQMIAARVDLHHDVQALTG